MAKKLLDVTERREWRVHVTGAAGFIDYYLGHYEFRASAEHEIEDHRNTFGLTCTIESRPVGEWTAEGGETTKGA